MCVDCGKQFEDGDQAYEVGGVFVGDLICAECREIEEVDANLNYYGEFV